MLQKWFIQHVQTSKIHRPGAIGHLEVTHQTQRGDDRQSDDGHCHEGHRCSAVHRVALAKHDLRGWPDGKLTSLDSLYVKQVYTIYICIYICIHKYYRSKCLTNYIIGYKYNVMQYKIAIY